MKNKALEKIYELTNHSPNHINIRLVGEDIQWPKDSKVKSLDLLGADYERPRDEYKPSVSVIVGYGGKYTKFAFTLDSSLEDILGNIERSLRANLPNLRRVGKDGE